jgi:hypothetical protein
MASLRRRWRGATPAGTKHTRHTAARRWKASLHHTTVHVGGETELREPLCRPFPHDPLMRISGPSFPLLKLHACDQPQTDRAHALELEYTAPPTLPAEH